MTDTVTRENLFDCPRHVIVFVDGREYSGEVCKPKKPDGYPTVVYLTTDGFVRVEFTVEAILYAIKTEGVLYG